LLARILHAMRAYTYGSDQVIRGCPDMTHRAIEKELESECATRSARQLYLAMGRGKLFEHAAAERVQYTAAGR
jgi:hypothetical protein